MGLALTLLGSIFDSVTASYILVSLIWSASFIMVSSWGDGYGLVPEIVSTFWFLLIFILRYVLLDYFIFSHLLVRDPDYASIRFASWLGFFKMVGWIPHVIPFEFIPIYVHIFIFNWYYHISLSYVIYSYCSFILLPCTITIFPSFTLC